MRYLFWRGFEFGGEGGGVVDVRPAIVGCTGEVFAVFAECYCPVLAGFLRVGFQYAFQCPLLTALSVDFPDFDLAAEAYTRDDLAIETSADVVAS